MTVVTAIVPVGHHHPPFLRRAVGSLFAQTDPDWEALVVAERAERAAIERVLAEALEDPRVTIVDNDRAGLAAAGNTGMRVATTAFVALLLGDDMWAPEAVATIAEHRDRHPDADFLHSGRVFVDEHDAPISSPYLPTGDATPEAFARYAPVKHLLCWRRELGLAIGGMDERLRWVGPDDFDFPWTMAERGAVFHAIPAPLYLHRDHREGFRLTTHAPRREQERELRYIFRKHGLPRAAQRRRIRQGRAGYLKQAIYRNRLDRRLKQLIGYDPRRGWREPYT
jgi:glycosyltransferase involved in cell wall biosynthesis